MHLNLVEFRELLDTTTYLAFEQIVGFIRSNYVMDEFFDGKNEIKFRRSGKTLVTIIMKDFKFTTLIIFGKDEREKFDNMRTKFSNYICNYYDNSKTYHDGKWMFICIENSKYIKEIIELIKIKKKPNEKIITMCGYRCDLCKAFAGNIKKNDQRQQLSEMWKKYYNLEIAAEDIYCDGCRCIKKGAKRIDGGCPVRECVINNAINSCADCNKYPCSLFEQREGLCFEKAQMMKGNSFCVKEYYEFILAYDNKSRLEGLIKFNHTK